MHFPQKFPPNRVKLAIDIITEEQAAVKMIKLDDPSLNMKRLKNEVDVMKNMSHPNIINLKEFHEEIEYVKKSGKIVKVVAIVMELAQGGELFGYVANTGRFEENEARTYFRQLISTIGYCHDQGFSHRDLKAENLLFDSEFNLKVADFGFSTLLASKDGSGQLKTILGTPNYMAPELRLKEPYSGSAVDIFACGIVLFMMVSGTPPFDNALPDDNYYKLIWKNSHSDFWKAHEKFKVPAPGQKNFYSEDFRSLINSMFAPNPDQRLTIAEIMAHPWYKGETCSVEKLKRNFQKRKEFIDAEILRRKEGKQQQMEMIQQLMQNIEIPVGGSLSSHKPYRSIPTGTSDLETMKTSNGKFNPDAKRTLEQDEEDIERTSTCRVFYPVEADILLKLLVVICNEVCNEYEVSDDTYKVKGRILTDGSNTIDLTIVIKKVSDETNVIEFNRRKGAILTFYDIIEKRIKAPLEKFITT